jgi:hypothetical protein
MDAALKTNQECRGKSGYLVHLGAWPTGAQTIQVCQLVYSLKQPSCVLMKPSTWF